MFEGLSGEIAGSGGLTLLVDLSRCHPASGLWRSLSDGATSTGDASSDSAVPDSASDAASGEAPFEVFQKELEAWDRAEELAGAAQADAGALMRSLERVRSEEARIAAGKLELIASLYARPEMIPLPARRTRGERHRDLTAWDLVKEEIRLFFALTHREAERMLDAAIMLTTRLPKVMAELKAGRLGYARATKIAQHAKKLTDHHYQQGIDAGLSPKAAEQRATATGARVEDLVLERAADMQPWDLEKAMIATVMLIDPAYAISLRKHNHRGRGVSHRTNPGEGTGDLFARLPAAEAQAIYATLDAYARHFRDTGDPRTLDELRADALMGIFFDTLDPTSATPNDADQHDHETTDHETTDSGDAGTAPDGAGDDPWNAADGVTDPVQGRSEDPPLDDRRKGDSPHRQPVPGVEPDSGAGGPRGPAGDWTLRPRSGLSRLRTEVQVTISLDTLLGRNDDPATLAGHGPIDAAYARALAHGPDSTWRRLVTDPVTGQLLDYGRTRYRAPSALADHVRARDTTCRTPGCAHPATASDLDHVVPYPAGSTSDVNLQTKCRRDHRLKHEGRWRHEVSTDPLDPPHTIVLTSPAGRRYVTHATNFDHPWTRPTRTRPTRARTGSETQA
jgi:Domain of unknown function (DUF222)